MILGGGIANARKYAKQEETQEGIVVKEGYSAVIEPFGIFILNLLSLFFLFIFVILTNYF